MCRHLIIVCVLLCLTAGAKSQISPDSLLLYLPLNGNTNDYSGNNYNGVNYDAKPIEGFSGKPNTAYYFNGKNAIVVPNIAKLEGPIKAFTFLVRLKPAITRNTESFYNILSWQRHRADPFFSYQHGKLRFGWQPPQPNYHPFYDFFGYYGDWCTDNEYTSNGFEVDTASANNQWQTVALVYNEGNLKTYFDCKVMNDWVDYFPKVADLCGNEPMEIIIGNIMPGASNSTDRNFVGIIDEVRMYKRALSNAEVLYFADSVCRAIGAPIPKIGVTPDPCHPNDIVFNDSSKVSAAVAISKRVWKISGGDSAFTKDFSHLFTTPGQYTVQLSLYSGNQVFTTDTVISITTFNSPKFLKASQAVVATCVGSQVQLNVTGGVKYSWMPCASLNDCSIASPVAKGDNDVEFVVTGYNKDNCADTTHITLKVITAENAVYIPNAFTPNGDASNDTWGVASVAPLQDFSVSIYNRWGINVFNTKNQGNKWDGNIKSGKAPPGTYVWVLNYKNGTGCADMKRKGTVLLIR